MLDLTLAPDDGRITVEPALEPDGPGRLKLVDNITGDRLLLDWCRPMPVTQGGRKTAEGTMGLLRGDSGETRTKVDRRKSPNAGIPRL